MTFKLFLAAALYFTYVTLAFSHGVGGGTFSSNESKKYNRPTPVEPITTIKPITERLKFTLRTDRNIAKLWISTDLNEPVDTSLTSATVLLKGDGSPVLFKMMPTNEGHIMGTIPVKMTNATTFDVILRIPGERPVTLSFIPGQSDKPMNVSQKVNY